MDTYLLLGELAAEIGCEPDFLLAALLIVFSFWGAVLAFLSICLLLFLDRRHRK